MPSPGQSTCRRCGAGLCVGETLCPTCLFVAGDSTSEEDRIFQQALALGSSKRIGFIQEATSGNAALLEAVLIFLQGYEAAGRDKGQATPGETCADSNTEQPGLVIHHFRLISLIGEGGMGSVWKAEQMAPVKRMVAIKVIKLGMDTREVVKRFSRERQTLALLNHANIAQVFEAGATALGRPYFAMELVEGQPITTYCETANLDVEARLKLFQEVCAAVEHAHQKGIIHRDLKPSNILVAKGVVKVIDFGVAKATQSVGNTPLFTRQAQIVGTPAYMSPEQAQTAGLDIDTRTDIYSLGVVLFELLTGALPIDPARLARASIAEMQRILLEEEPPNPSTLLEVSRPTDQPVGTAGVPRRCLRGDLDWVVLKAIRKSRNERYSSPAPFADDIQRYLPGELVSAVPPTLAYRARKFVQRHRAGDANRTSASHLRALTWRNEAMTAVRAFDTGFEHLEELFWNARYPALIAVAVSRSETQVWDLEKEELWTPAAKLKARRAAWDPTGDRIALSLADSIAVLEYPSGQ